MLSKVRTVGLASGAGGAEDCTARLPAVIWMEGTDLKSSALAEALAGAVRSLGWAALQALDRCGMLWRDAAAGESDDNLNTGVWIVRPEDEGEARRGAAVAVGTAGAADGGMECYASFDALAGSRLDDLDGA